MLRAMTRWHRGVALFFVSALGAACSTPAPPVTPPPPGAAPASPPPAPSMDPTGDWQIRWDRGFAGWSPTIFDGKLSLEREGGRWTARIAFRQSSAQLECTALQLAGDRIDIAFRAANAKSEGKTSEAPVPVELRGFFHEGRLLGEIRWGRIDWTPMGGRRLVLPRLVPGSVDHALPSAPLDPGAVDQAGLDALLQRAAEERSSAVVIVRDGKIGVERYREGYDGSPLVAMSASKSVVSMAVGMLIADGKLGLDTTMASLFPEWKALGPKGTITVRHLLTHTSGLDTARATWEKESIRERALAAKLLFQPGTRFQYNNGAVDFLAAVFAKAAGVSLDVYLEARLFQKLDIVGAQWMKDTEGTPRGAGELAIRPVDLAKLGQLMLDGGVWKGERIVPAAWIEQSIAPGQPFQEAAGLLWWREGSFSHVLTDPVLAAWRDLGFDQAVLKDAVPLVGKRFGEWSSYAGALEKALGGTTYQKLQAALHGSDHVPRSASVSDGPARGFAARGWLGQFLVVLPKPRVVAVRMRKVESGEQGDKDERDAYPGFGRDLARAFP